MGYDVMIDAETAKDTLCMLVALVDGSITVVLILSK